MKKDAVQQKSYFTVMQMQVLPGLESVGFLALFYFFFKKDK